jgi:mono/diheme cytochrome c family protein
MQKRGFASAVLGMGAVVLVAASAIAIAQPAPATPAPPATPETPAAPDPALEALKAELIAEGRTVYSRNCSPCHGGEGQGQPPGQGAAPPLAGSTFLSADMFVVRQVLYGGGAYMPAFSNFTDRQVAAVVTYARNSFGNSFGVLTEAAVAANR